MDVGDELLRRIRENPDDDAARQVYGDHLCGLGDPRGELIALQYARLARPLTLVEERREADLIWRHGSAWVGPFASATSAPRFERGFLAACRLTALPPAAIGHPCWATLRRVSFAPSLGGAAPAAFVSHPEMRALREVADLSPEALLAVCEEGMGGGVERLQVAGPFDPLLRKALGAGRGLVGLRQLALTGPLEELTAVVGLARSPLGARLEQLIATRDSWQLTLSRTDAGLTSLGALGGAGTRGTSVEPLRWLISALAPEGLTRLQVRVAAGVRLEASAWAPLELAASQHRKLESVELPRARAG